MTRQWIIISKSQLARLMKMQVICNTKCHFDYIPLNTCSIDPHIYFKSDDVRIYTFYYLYCELLLQEISLSFSGQIIFVNSAIVFFIVSANLFAKSVSFLKVLFSDNNMRKTIERNCLHKK